jgi:release factor glutamine methyltransferase
VKLIRLPGVHSPVSDTWLLAEAARREQLAGARFADLCTGTGALAISASWAGAGQVVAVDLARRAVISAFINARLNRARVEVRRGDLFAPLAGERFDVIVSNPPYIPAESDRVPRHGMRVALDAGRNGRAFIDRICAGAPSHLTSGGVLLIVHSSICGVDRTCEVMSDAGLKPTVVAEQHGPLGPVMTARATMLRERGLLGTIDAEDMAVVRGELPIHS